MAAPGQPPTARTNRLAAKLGLPADTFPGMASWLGAGSFGEVWLCQYRRSQGAGETVPAAVKILLKPVTSLSDDEVAWLEREAINQGLLHHRHVCKLSEVLEYVDGGTLRKCLDDRQTEIPVADKRKLFLQMVADFGLSKSPFQQGELATAVGTLAYAAPEVLGGKYDGEKVDVYSSGVTLYEMMFGDQPFAREPGTNRPLDLRTRSDQQVMYQNKRKLLLAFPAASPANSLELQKLLQGMLCPDSSARLSLAEVLEHPWCREGETPARRERLEKEAAEARRLREARLQGGQEARPGWRSYVESHIAHIRYFKAVQLPA
ncbi:hypothetical protein HYH03_001028 [Edaphochlamys debaryana]|uniref:Protein kinase domain-containing protein n=1 Tax=Edaphochlamys debaryana TaxID=47281 RepID=A0A835YMH3_9CHLO|nr:hypothetical protein HYH03_001028 [Edaphochlamys debaryana]|eukprot:KAG2501215.1 hypothetical protein HYH03_001028 [Edaphochlamys debaryana]